MHMECTSPLFIHLWQPEATHLGWSTTLALWLSDRPLLGFTIPGISSPVCNEFHNNRKDTKYPNLMAEVRN